MALFKASTSTFLLAPIGYLWIPLLAYIRTIFSSDSLLLLLVACLAYSLTLKIVFFGIKNG
jgi:hypothetical protein